MARINIEDCWWTDPRRSALIRVLGKQEFADGIAIQAWRLAQEFWKKDRQLVPKALFEVLEGASALLQVGLAEVREDMVYIRGSSAYLDWLNQSKEAGRAGGLKSAAVRKEKYGTAQPEANSNPPSNKSKGLEPSSSSSFSSSKDLKQEQKQKEPLRGPGVKLVFDLERLYEGYPRKRGKTPGLKTLSKTILTEKAFGELDTAIQNYAKDSVGKESKHVMYFSTFAGQWRDWINVETDHDACSVNTTPINLEDLK